MSEQLKDTVDTATVEAVVQETPTTKELVNQAFSQVLESLQQAGEFAKEQIPLVLQEMLQWELWSSIFIGVIFAAFAIFSYKALKWSYGKFQNSTYDEEGYGFLIALLAVCITGSIIGVVVNVLSAIKVLVAPRVYLIEHISNMIN